MVTVLKEYCQRAHRWVTCEDRQRKAREIAADVERAFTKHPHETGETYWQHLWFTTTMAGRFLFTMLVLVIHGIFPFLLMRAASKQIEAVYKIMRSRVPKTRRDVIDADYQV